MAANVDRQLYKKFKDMYEGLMKGDMEKVLRHYDELPVPLPDCLTVFGDTLLHIATYMKHEDIAREILKNYVQDDTVLHKVAATNMVNLARDLLIGAPELLSSKNTLGETPLFKAAYNGQHEMFDVLSHAVNQKHKDKDKLNEHLIRKDKANILHITIVAEFFDLAFIIARKYPHLIDEIDEAGKIGLQLLANNPSAFRSSRNYGLLKRLIFKYCVPTSIKHEKKGHWDESDTHSYELGSFKHEEQDNNIPKPRVGTTPRTCTRWMSIVASGQNVLHIAIKHRQLEIFNHIVKMTLSISRLVIKIDKGGYTILHQVADISNYSGGTLPGPALQLQEELHWFQIVPNHYLKHRSFIKEESLSKKKKKTSKEDEPSSIQETERIQETALELFARTHENLLEEAGEWLKNTSESCSTVAVLIATVAFAAAYTVPGGSDPQTGAPILLHDPFFLVLTVTDVLSLATSLTSVVMFLSILTSPFELQDFEESLPRKLILGFTFLFISVAMTMLAFAATIVLTIHLKRRWVTTLVYCLAFLPVAVFALLQYPLYVAFMATVTYSRNIIKHSLPPLPKWFSKDSLNKSD
ncbi:hypothetical protein FEM48_ZijujUnG0103300 [Ziziphus jujuba var. spinosa]|uniref:PGG domain-containing protein n=1 Tax=Ziziphus jujuba var. spinosa TaxID=714518 RepID=A0A978U876_ZIZJJ|nr:hypothetical protein FEM48_ZijujUnG0103300 [Ziziphus jujuba var. spinosa]